MKKLISGIIFLLIAASVYPQATLTEIMFRPSDSNSEFIEIHNLSQTQALDLTGYKIKYQTSSADSLIPTGSSMQLNPNMYAVIFEGDYDFENGIYKNLVPPEALILKIDDNAFGSSGMSNSSDRSIYLFSPSDDTLEVYLYSANNSAGVSDEKIILSNDNNPGNWSNSITVNGTPGFKNSVAQNDFDLSVQSLSVVPEEPQAGSIAQFNLIIKNQGIVTAENFTVGFYHDINSDSTAEADELFSLQNPTSLASGDSMSVSAEYLFSVPGEKQIIVQVDFPPDEDTTNNRSIKIFLVDPEPQQFNDAVINEIMYSPASGEPEWIEIFNRSGDSIDLIDWRLKDNSSSGRLTNESFIIDDSSFCVLADDSTIFANYQISSPVLIFNLPSLNNGGDDIVLLDAAGNRVDSVSYVPDWGGGSGISLERIDADEPSNDQQNWSSAVEPLSATPGFINSTSPKNVDLSLSEFSPQSDYGIIGGSIEFRVLIKNSGLTDIQSSQLEIYHDVNKDSIAQQNELINSLPVGFIAGSDSLETNVAVSGFAEGLNNYIAELKLDDDEFIYNNLKFSELTGVSINEIREDIVINEIMFNPPTEEPEWVELFNRSNKTIDLKEYQIADASDTSAVVEESVILSTGEFLVVAKDSSIIQKYGLTGSVVVSGFPTLNNTSDMLMVLDSLDRVIDSLEYFSSWGEPDISLERIDPFGLSASETNWAASKDPLAGTPGKTNSVTQKVNDVSVKRLIFDPEFPLVGDGAEIYTDVINAGKNSAIFNLLLFEDFENDSIPDLRLDNLSSLQLNPGDSSRIKFNYSITSLRNEMNLIALAEFSADEDTANNIAFNSIAPAYSASALLLSEIMYLPENGEPEWLELFNPSEDTVNIKDWMIADVITSPDTQIITTENFQLLPNEYLVISKDSSIFEFHRSIPSQVLIASFPNLNNDGDGVLLLDNSGSIIDNVIYDSGWDYKVGHSIERISYLDYSTSPTNWGYSIDIEQSTPGRINSISEKDYDLTISDIYASPKNPLPGDMVFVDCKIINAGIQTAGSYSADFFYEDSGGRFPLGSGNGSNLAGKDSIIIRSPNSFVLNDSALVSVKLFFEQDEDTLNNYFDKFIVPGFAEGSVKINEIMYNPLEEKTEWIELVCTSNSSVDIGLWEISDLLTSPTKNIIADTSTVMMPGEYFIVTSDTSSAEFDTLQNTVLLQANFGTLGNTEDGVVLYDFRGALIDSIKYNSDWGGSKGVSLERLSLSAPANDSTNWASSLAEKGSTPGIQNSLISIPTYSREDLIINEIMFAPDAGNAEFIELYNLSDKNINIGGWKIEYENGESIPVSQNSKFVFPSGFNVIASDSSIFMNYPELSGNNNVSTINRSSLSLSNDSQLLILKDLRGNLIDSLVYFSDWHNRNISITRNRSLERLNPHIYSNDPANWSTSVSDKGATPGAQNSIYTGMGLSRTADISIEPNPFSPDNDGFEDFAIISYNLTQAIAQIRIKVYDSKGRLVRTIANNRSSGSSGEVIFDGLDNAGNPLRIGIYILFFEAINSSSGVLETFKKPVVIARKL